MTSLVTNWWVGKLKVKEISLRASQDVNGGYPVALDIVFAMDDSTYEELAVLDAAQWFKRRDQFLQRPPEKIQVLPQEVVPGGQVIINSELKESFLKARQIFAFADYSNDAASKVALPNVRTIELTLNASSASLERR